MVKMPFKPRAQILLQLGEQLIKNENVAVLELVKNSYDADARNVNVVMQNIDDPSSGYIEIVDDGLGMDLDTVQNIWMEPGNNHKKKIVEANNRSELGRLPIGEKGIGRFGVHKLGKVITLITRKKNCNEVVLEIDWNKFETAEYLEDVEILIRERIPEVFCDDKSGTYLKVSDLSTKWTRGMVRNLARAINSLNSPFSSNSSFYACLTIDKQEWLNDIADFEMIKDLALYEAEIVLSNSKIVEFSYEFNPYEFLSNIKSRKVSYCDIEMTRSVKVAGKTELQVIDLSSYKIGDIRLKLYAYDRDSSVMSYIKDGKAIKGYLDENGGISVFRDGMRVLDYGEPGNDWLGLDLKRVNAPAKNLSNNIILGAVLIDREHSVDLKEKANREGFIENDAYEVFRDAVLFALSQFTAQRNIDKDNLRVAVSGGAKEPVKEKISEVRSLIEQSNIEPRLKTQIDNSLKKVEEELEYLKNRYVQTANAGLSYGIVIHEIEKIINELKIEAKKEGTSIKVRSLSSHLARVIESYAELLRNKAKTVTEARKIVEQALFSVEYRLDAHNIEVINNTTNNTASVNCATNMVVGAIINLIDNSIYWTTYSKKPEKRIYIGLTEDYEGYIGIVVADNGVGYRIAGEDAIKPFVSTRQEGIGLGLNIVNEIMIAQKGKILFPEEGDIELPSEFKGGAITVLALKKEN